MIEDKLLDTLCWDDYLWEGEHVPSYAADFETTTFADDCRVWAWAVCEVGRPDDLQYGNSIESFIDWCMVHAGSRVYFHNLKFDGKFILSYILQNGWKWIPVKDECGPGKFTTLISDMGQFYSIKLWFAENASIEFLDSLKIIPLPIAEIPKAFGLDIEKLDMDYVEYREAGHVLTPDEKEYISHDVQIAAQALDIMHTQGMTKMTAGSNAFKEYQKSVGGRRRFRDWFPEPDYDADLRAGGCYKGGFTAVNPKYAGRIVGPGCSFDVNSLYPSVMAGAHGEVLPYGAPVVYDGEYEFDPEYPRYIQYVEADFRIKPGFIPCLQLKGNRMFGATEYITDSHGPQVMCLTQVDLELLKKHYDIGDIRYIRGYKFKGSKYLFRDYVETWTEVKTKASIEGNEGMRTIAKLLLNSLYGKMATNPVKQSRAPYLEDGVVKFRLLPEEYKEGVYLPAGAFITSYARSFTISAAQANYDRWLYSDTDSCYFLGTEPPRGLRVHDTDLGAWKRENEFDRFKALRAKTYCFEEGGALIIHCAGMPTRCHAHVTMENFEYGNSFEGKLKPKDVKGGTILEDTMFTIHK